MNEGMREAIFANKWKAQIKARNVTLKEILDDMPDDMVFALGANKTGLIFIDTKREFEFMKDIIRRGYDRKAQYDAEKRALKAESEGGDNTPPEEETLSTEPRTPFEDRIVRDIWKSKLQLPGEPIKLQIRIFGEEYGIAYLYEEWVKYVKAHLIECDIRGEKIGRFVSYKDRDNPVVV